MTRAFSSLLSVALALQAAPASAQRVVRGALPARGAAPGYAPLFDFSVARPRTAAPAPSLPASASSLPFELVPAAPLLPTPLVTPVAPLKPEVLSSLTPWNKPVVPFAPTPSASIDALRGALPGPAGLRAGAALAALSASLSRPLPTAGADARFYDGAGPRLDMRYDVGPSLEPSFETPALPPVLPEQPEAVEAPSEAPKRPRLSFPPVAKSGLLSYEPSKAITASISRVRPYEGSKSYWNQFKKGVEVDVVSRDENVFGRPTVVTRAVTKPIGQLTREDFEGTVPAHQLKAGVRSLRASLVARLEEKRRAWQPEDAPVDLKTPVRVVAFKSYLELFREAHGPGAVPQPEAPAPRAPLKAAAEGALGPLSYVLPRAVFLDLDMLEGPLAPELLSDIAKLQRTGVYFVAFSRKPYAAAGALKERLIRRMSSYQLGVLMPIRFLAVTDDGAVISHFPKGGNVAPVSVAAFTDAEMDVLRDAAQKAAEEAGISPRSLREQAQPRIDDYADEVPGLTRRPRAAGKPPQVRFELLLPKSADSAVHVWRAAFERRLVAHNVAAKLSFELTAGAGARVTLQKTDLAGSMDRLQAALREQFGLYLNPGDALVLTKDPALLAANPKALDVAALTGLEGSALVENALGLILGEHRENREGDLAGSASRMAQFTRDRQRYLTEALIEQDKEEQNINFFSGHAVHSANDWLVWELQNGRRPARDEYEAHLRERWNSGLRELKPIGLPSGHDMEGWLRESVQRGLSMYEMVLRIHDRGEILIGTEIPNFFVLKDYARRSGELKRRYVLHTIFDFVALRPDPRNPGRATVVIYDFKTGPAKSRQKLDKDLQVLTYALFANTRWVGKDFPAPYLVGPGSYRIDAASIEFIYNAVKQVSTVNAWDLDTIRRKIIGTLNRLHAAEQKLLNPEPAKTPKKRPAKRGRKK